MFKKIVESFSRYQRYRQTIRELSRMTDRELADIGLGRSDIYDVARETCR